MDSKVEGKEIDSREEQFRNVPAPKEVTPSGTTTSSSEEQWVKEREPMDFKVEGRETDLREEQSQKAYFPTEVAPLLISTAMISSRQEDQGTSLTEE